MPTNLDLGIQKIREHPSMPLEEVEARELYCFWKKFNVVEVSNTLTLVIQTVETH